MAHINQLPDELFYLIFKELSFEEILDCQQVCRAWYTPAHITLLKDLEFWETTAIEKFTNSLDHNPQSSYLNAVQKIEFNNLDDKGSPISKEMISKIFFRFPNLKEVRVIDSLTVFDEFDDEVCHEFLANCTKLDMFEVNSLGYDQVLSGNILYKLRSLVTIMNVGVLTHETQFGTTLEFISKFSRLKKLQGRALNLNNFQEILPVLYELPELASLGVLCATDYQENSLGNYTEPQLVERLARIKELELVFFRDFHLNTIAFVAKYITGLDYLDFRSPCHQSWNSVQQRLFCNSMVDLICSAKQCSALLMMRRSEAYLPHFINQLTTAINTKCGLVLNIEDRTHCFPQVLIAKNEKEVNCTTTVKMGKGQDLLQTASYLFNTTVSLNNISDFELIIQNRRSPMYAQETNTDMFGEILRAMRSLKSVTLDVPEYITITETNDPTHSCILVDSLALRATPDARIQTLLDRYFYTFPNLKHLSLCYCCGLWDEDMNECRIDLLKYSLQSLSIDITPVAMRMLKLYKEQDFIVVAVTVLCSSTKFIFKVSLDLSAVTSVTNTELKGLIYEEDYCQVNINITDLKCLEICANAYINLFEDTYCHRAMDHTNRATVDLN